MEASPTATRPADPQPATDRHPTERAPNDRPAPSAPRALVEVEYFTDPLCCWSWAIEPQWRRLRYELGTQLAWRYRMGGMIQDWDSYGDPVNSIHRPSQMGPLWYQVREMSGMPLEHRLWVEDPPRSSYPACAAVKAAELQSPEAAEAYLRRLREATMLRRMNVARPETLQQLADELTEDGRVEFDAARFAADLHSRPALDAFREDLRRGRYLEIGRYPTLIVRRAGEERGLLLVGYRPYDSLRKALCHVDDRLEWSEHAPSSDQYKTYWGSVLERELQELKRPAHGARRT